MSTKIILMKTIKLITSFSIILLLSIATETNAQCGTGQLSLDNQTNCDFDYLVYWDTQGNCTCTNPSSTGTVSANSSVCIAIGCNGNPQSNPPVEPWLIRITYTSPAVAGGDIVCPSSFPGTKVLTNNCSGTTQLRWESRLDAIIEEQ